MGAAQSSYPIHLTGAALVNEYCDLSLGSKRPRRGNLRCDWTAGCNFQVRIDTCRGFAPLGDGPYNERLPAAHIARGEDSGKRRHVVLIGGDVAAIVELNSELLDHSVPHGAEESHRDKDKIGIHGELAACNRFKLRGRANSYGMKLADIAVFVPGQLCSSDAPVANAAFFVSTLDAQLHRPQRPRRERRALVGRLGHDFELMNRNRLLAMDGAETIGAGVSASDNHNVF